jgi:hypothetical protein
VSLATMLRLLAVLAVVSACAPSTLVPTALAPTPGDAAALPHVEPVAPASERAPRLSPPFQHATATRRVPRDTESVSAEPVVATAALAAD